MQSEPIKAALDEAEIVALPLGETAQQAVHRLSALPPLEYEKIRETEATKLDVRVSVLDNEVSASRKINDAPKSRLTMFAEVPIWPQSVDGDALLSEIVSAIHRYIICDKETAIAAALWCAFTWVIDFVEVAPLVIITAPEKRCGKSQFLNLMGKLVRKPLVASNISPSATFRVIEAYQPTLLIDEVDTFIRDNEEMRGVINSGHTRPSAYVIRNVGENHEPTQFSTWGAKALSGIGKLPDTIMDRSIILMLRRRLPHESLERLRHADADLFETLASKLARFADDFKTTIEKARPTLPDALNDRAQDNWEPLLAIADCIGGEWPKIARETALLISGAAQNDASFSAELLADIRDIFEAKRVERISSKDLIKGLCEDDEKSWATYNRGQSIKPRQLSKMLGEYGIHSKTVRIGYETPRGFDINQFADAFLRYLSPSTDSAIHTPQSNYSAAIDVLDAKVFPKQTPHVADCFATKQANETVRPALTNDCGIVSDSILTIAEGQQM